MRPLAATLTTRFVPGTLAIALLGSGAIALTGATSYVPLLAFSCMALAVLGVTLARERDVLSTLLLVVAFPLTPYVLTLLHAVGRSIVLGVALMALGVVAAVAALLPAQTKPYGRRPRPSSTATALAQV